MGIDSMTSDEGLYEHSYAARKLKTMQKIPTSQQL